MKYLIILLFFFQIQFHTQAQEFQFKVELEELNMAELGGLQSYAIAQHNQEWLIIGGRLDGLHLKQPFATFDAAGNNNQIIVVNPITEEIWKSDLSSLPVSIKEQLSATNMQFQEVKQHLILTGGYAYSPTSDEHITFPYLTVIEVPALIDAVKSNGSLSPHIKQIQDDKFAVAGGSLNNIDDVLYLIGGHKFEGRYNPHGPDHGPGFVQEYTYEVRPFTLQIEDEITVTHLDATHNEMHLRRRDYNLVSHIKNDKKELMIFSGVFQENADIPWLYPVSITPTSLTAIESFTQYFNHYHCANLPIYNSTADEMHTIFFGGIAQFYEEDNVLVQDNDVPFVNTIADVTRIADGSLIETKISSLSSLMGSGSEFIPHHDAPIFIDDVIDGDQIGSNPMFIGYIFGGITSSMANIFWINDGNQSMASRAIYKVFISKERSQSGIEQIKEHHSILIYPRPAQGILRIAIDLKAASEIQLDLFNLSGGRILFEDKGMCQAGMNIFTQDISNHASGSYILQATINDQQYSQKIIINP